MIDTNEIQRQLVDGITAHVQKQIDLMMAGIADQIEDLRRDVPVLDGWQADKVYRHNTLAEAAGSLWQYDADERKWRMIVHTISDVKLRHADGVAVLEFTKPDGSSFDREIRFAA